MQHDNQASHTEGEALYIIDLRQYINLCLQKGTHQTKKMIILLTRPLDITHVDYKK